MIKLIEPDFSTSKSCVLYRNLVREDGVEISDLNISKAGETLDKLISAIHAEFMHTEFVLKREADYVQKIGRLTTEFYEQILPSESRHRAFRMPPIDTSIELEENFTLLQVFQYEHIRREKLQARPDFWIRKFEVGFWIRKLNFTLKPLRENSSTYESIRSSLQYMSVRHKVKLLSVFGYDSTETEKASNTKLLWYAAELKDISHILKYGPCPIHGKLRKVKFNFNKFANWPIYHSIPNIGLCERVLLLCKVDM